jgi:hypothetical protein
MPDPIRRLRAEARQFAHGKVPKAVRYPVAFRTAVGPVYSRIGHQTVRIVTATEILAVRRLRDLVRPAHPSTRPSSGHRRKTQRGALLGRVQPMSYIPHIARAI